jgi:hypothetical protein
MSSHDLEYGRGCCAGPGGTAQNTQSTRRMAHRRRRAASAEPVQQRVRVRIGRKSASGSILTILSIRSRHPIPCASTFKHQTKTRATRTMIAKRRHPGIDDLQSSSSQGPISCSAEPNATIPEMDLPQPSAVDEHSRGPSPQGQKCHQSPSPRCVSARFRSPTSAPTHL